MRIGMGYDVHRLVEGRKLILGGVVIPYEKGLLGHSDADVLLHAIMDALLGAAALGDIGKHFPDTDPAYEGISSLELLKKVGELLKEHTYFIGNIDATVIAQRPKLAPYREQMRENIATFSSMRPLSKQERNALLTIAEGMKKAVPCTACRYCCDGCPKHLDIPTLLSAYNELTITPSFNIGMFVEALPADKRPDACIACGRCTRICPQSINVPAFLRDFSDRLSKMPSWAEICRQRDAAQK